LASVGRFPQRPFSVTPLLQSDTDSSITVIDASSTKKDIDKTKTKEQRIALIGRMQEDVSALSCVPKEHVEHRFVRIYVPAKNAMQSGTFATRYWSIEWDAWERWENPLMGWTSSGDPLSNLKCQFESLEDAIAYCERNRWKYIVEQPQNLRRRVKSYGDNFSWDKRTRNSTK